MQQFAVTTVSPRSIAWIIRLNEWDRFEKIIKYNCAVIGGYFNVVIPLTANGVLSPSYVKFLTAYDADIIVMPPRMSAEQYSSITQNLHPFAIIPWEIVHQFVPITPMGYGSGMNTPINWTELLKDEPIVRQPLIAVASDNYPDTSRLAFVACGDIEAEEPTWLSMDDVLNFNATGYRELFLQKFLKPEFDIESIAAHLDEEENLVPPSDRFKLESIIEEMNQFPLTNCAAILDACLQLQDPTTRRSFIGVTATHKNSGRIFNFGDFTKRRRPSLTILVSDTFELEEALLFWNLRASDNYVAWLPFHELESCLEDVAKWIDSDYHGGFYVMMNSMSSGIAFSTSSANLDRLQEIVSKIQEKRTRTFAELSVMDFSDSLTYNYARPYLSQERVNVLDQESKCALIPPLPMNEKKLGSVYAVTLEWTEMMLPRSTAIVNELISPRSIENAAYYQRNGQEVETIQVSKYRITKDHHLRGQFNSNLPLEFGKPSPDQIFSTLFQSAGFIRMESSSAARYHKEFVRRSGDIETATAYLKTSPYRELLSVLANNNRRSLPGWIINSPEKRRALSHLHLLEVMGIEIPIDTRQYFNISDILPKEVLELLEKQLLERGFLLKCQACSFNSWYPVDHVGQVFECYRCFQSQVFQSNPLWLYKMPEVLFQGFQSNMEVPLLALNYLRSKCTGHFDWVYDSDIYYSNGVTENSRNIDILCLSNGNVYIGEAKSNDRIDEEQFAFYEDLCKKLSLDGVVFATSKQKWSEGTIRLVDNLKLAYSGEILILTYDELYLNN